MTGEALREGLLEDVAIVVAAAPDAPLADVIQRRCGELGGRVTRVAAHENSEENRPAAPEHPQAGSELPDLLVTDAGSLFAAGGEGLAALRACLDGTWNAVRAVVADALAGSEAHTGGARIVNVAPRPDAGAHAGAARSGLENLARTLSVEWARHGVVTTTIAPGAATAPEAVAELVAFLASPAGGYFSGCVFALDELSREA